MRARLGEETLEQMRFFSYIDLHPKIKDFVFHIPNEGKRSKIGGQILKKIGLKSGVSDVFVAIPTEEYHGLFIEMKSKSGRVSETQKIFMENMKKNGYRCEVCYGSSDAINVLDSYLGR